MATFDIMTLVNAGNPAFDLSKYLVTEAGREWLSRAYNIVNYEDEMDPAVIEYWKNYGKGLKKELHDADNPKLKWSSFVPLSAEKEPDRKYPVVISMHGGGDSIFHVEAFGYVHVAAEKELIALLPEDESVDGVHRIIEEAKRLYPVDDERVYVTGFSYGGGMSFQSAILGHKYITAAHIIGTVHPGLDITEEEVVQVLPGIDKNGSAMLEKYKQLREASYEAQKYGMPVIHTGGMVEARMPFPLSKDPTGPKGGFGARAKMGSMEMWSRVNGCRKIEAADAGDSETEQMVGLKLDCHEVRKMLGIRCWIGDLLNSDGVPMMRFDGEEFVPHFPSAVNAEIGWEFMRHFRRDRNTHMTVYTPD